MAHQRFNYYKELPGWAKGLILIMILLAGMIVLFGTYKGIKKLIDIAKAKSMLNDSDTQLTALIQSGVKPSYNDAQYKVWAGAIFANTDGLGTHFVNVKNVFANLVNETDLYKLITAFGVKTISSGWLSDDFTGNLAEVLNDELNSDEIKSLNRLLQDKGINFQF